MQIVLPTAEELQKKLDSTHDHLDLLKMISDELSTELDLEKLLVLVAEKARELIEADTLIIPIIDTERKNYTYKAASGKNSELILGQVFPVSVGMCGWVLSKREPLIFGDNLPWLMDEKTRWEEGMESALLVPLIARGEIVGGLSGLGKQGGGSFTKEDFDLLQIFASQVSTAIDNARIFMELSAEKEHSETTLNSIGDAVVSTDAEGVVTRVNPVACHLLGWNQSEIIGQPLTEYFTIKNSITGEVQNNPVQTVMRTGKMVELGLNTVLINRYGKEYQIADSAAPIRNQDDELVGVILVFHDVSDEYRLVENLRKSEQKHRRLIEHLGNEFFMFVQDLSGQLSFVSPSIIRCLGYSQNEFIRKNSDYITDNEKNLQINSKFNQAIKGEIPDPYEIEVLNKQNQKNCLRVTKTPVFDDDGNVIAVEGLVQNITQLKALEASARQSQKMDAIEQLSGGIAHDFNNQLGVVMGYLEMLAESSEHDVEKTGWIETARKSAERCIDLTKSLMSFSRKKLSSQSIINLNDNILSAQSILQHTLTSAVELKLSLEPNLPNIVADEGEFQDVILNLMINARDALPSGGKVSVSTEAILLTETKQFYVNRIEPGRYVKLTVEDNGIGMSEDVLVRIFEPFYTTKPVGQGTGLGMAMVFGFITRVKGAIDVLSTVGEGTRFEFYMPQVRQSVITRSESTPVVDLPGGTETILLVEDEQALRGLATEYLITLGYQVEVAENAQEALSFLQQDLKIDLLFSDVVMPGGMDGFELAKQAKILRPGIRVLMATGYTSRKNRVANSDEKMDEILYKPYTRSILAQRLRRVLDKVIDENIIS